MGSNIPTVEVPTCRQCRLQHAAVEVPTYRKNLADVDKIKIDEHIFLIDEKKATLGSGSGVANFHPVEG